MKNMRRTPLRLLWDAFVAALPRLQAELSIALSESAELPGARITLPTRHMMRRRKRWPRS